MTEPVYRDVAEQERCVLYAEIEQLTKERDEARVEVERLRAALDGYPTMLEECAARIRGLIETYHDESEGLSEYFEYHGPQHSDENCPCDDTCECPESQKLHKAWDRWGHEVTLAYRRLDRIREALATLAGKGPTKEER
jgi:hypothetical protein